MSYELVFKKAFAKRGVSVGIMHEHELFSMPGPDAERFCGDKDFVFIIREDGTNVLKNQLAPTCEAAMEWYHKDVYWRIARAEETLRIEKKDW